VFADLVLDGCDDGGEEAVLRRFVLPVYGHVGGIAEMRLAGGVSCAREQGREMWGCDSRENVWSGLCKAVCLKVRAQI
jgi:hypothetical protein